MNDDEEREDKRWALAIHQAIDEQLDPDAHYIYHCRHRGSPGTVDGHTDVLARALRLAGWRLPDSQS